MEKSKTKYLLMTIAGVIIFSTYEVVSKTMSGAISGSLLTLYRFMLGGLILLPFAVKDMKKRKVSINKKDVGFLFLFGFLLVCVSMTLAQYGIIYSKAAICAVTFSANPLIVSILAAFVFKEKFTARKTTGLAIGLAGLLVTCFSFFSGIDNQSENFVLGVVLIIVAMLIFCIYTIYSKKILTSKIGPTATTSLVSIFGSITLLPVVIIQGAMNGTNPFACDIVSVMPQFLYCAIMGTGISYLLYFAGLANIETGTGSMIFMAKAPLASILAAIVLSEPTSIANIIGIVLIIAGMTIAVMQKKQKPVIST